MRLPTAGLVVLCLFHILPFVGRPALIGGDEPHYALMAHSMAVDRDLELENNYVAVENGSSAAGSRQAGKRLDRHVAEFGERTVFTHPLGLPLLVAPLLWVQDLVAPDAAPDLVLGPFGLIVTFLALLEGLRLLTQWTPDRRVGLLLGLVIYFGTPLWFYSRTFFTEPYLWSGLVLSVGLLDRDRPMFASLVLGVTLLIKETSLLAIGPILLWAWWRWGVLGFLRLSVFPALALLLFGLKNLWVYGEWWVTFQPFQVGSPWWSGFVGLLFDSQHGLIPFAPIAVVALLAWALPRGSWGRPFVGASGFALLAWVAYFIVSALWVDWRGGSGYGPRLLIPVLPVLALPLATLADDDRFPVAGWILAGAIAVLGFAVQWSAVTNPFGAFWSMSWRELVVGRPVPFLAGLSVGALFLWRYLRPAAGREGAAGGTLS